MNRVWGGVCGKFGINGKFLEGLGSSKGGCLYGVGMKYGVR